jgi:hypothetical protein
MGLNLCLLPAAMSASLARSIGVSTKGGRYVA